MHALIEADGLTKKFGKVQALSDLTLTLPAGQPVPRRAAAGPGSTADHGSAAPGAGPSRGSPRPREPAAVR